MKSTTKTAIGDIFEIRIHGLQGRYMLAQVKDFKVCAVGLETGNRFRESVTVQKVFNIQPNEMLLIFGSRAKVKKINKKFLTK